jgi:hypothetical protein
MMHRGGVSYLNIIKSLADRLGRYRPGRLQGISGRVPNLDNGVLQAVLLKSPDWNVAFPATYGRATHQTIAFPVERTWLATRPTGAALHYVRFQSFNLSTSLGQRAGGQPMSQSRIAAVTTVLACALAGCGTFVPGFGEFYDTAVPDSLIDALVSYVHCEVKSQVEFIILDDIDIVQRGYETRRHLQWLDDWGAQLSLTLTVEDKTTLSPGVTFNKILPNSVTQFPLNGNVTTAQLQTVSLGATGSADATRKAVISWFVDFREFTKERTDKPSTRAPLAAKGDARAAAKPVTDLTKRLTPELERAKRVYDRLQQEAIASGSTIASICKRPGGVLIEGDLKLREWLVMSLRTAFVQGGVTGDFAKDLQNEIKVAKKDVLQNQITFVVQYSGSVTPAWKLVQITANQSGNFFNAQRTRTQDLVITLGPAPSDANPADQQKQQNQDLAAAIGIAVANAIRSREQ